jgi:hypothetical protein
MSARRAPAVGWAVALAASALGLGLAAGAAAPGCAGPAELSVAPAVETDAGADGGADGGGGAPLRKRTIELRNPFGNVAKAQNLLWDGDFEWSRPSADQYGWLTGEAGHYLSYELPTIAIGAGCTSGIKCARLEPAGALAGVGVASRGHALDASFSARISTDDCAAALGSFVLAEDSQEPEVELSADFVDPDAAGLCSYRALVSERRSAIYLYIENRSDAAVMVDDAVVEPAATETRAARAALPPSAWAVDRARWARPLVRRALEPRDPPPNQVAEAYQAKVRRWR